MTTLTRADWEARAKDLKIEGRAFVNGEYSNAASGETFDCLSPVDGRFLAKVASCDLADAEQAVKVARNAFDSGAWSRLAPAKRKQTMIRFADLLLENAEEPGPAGNPGHGQADQRLAAHRRRQRRQQPALERRGDRQDL